MEVKKHTPEEEHLALDPVSLEIYQKMVEEDPTVEARWIEIKDAIDNSRPLSKAQVELIILNTNHLSGADLSGHSITRQTEKKPYDGEKYKPRLRGHGFGQGEYKNTNFCRADLSDSNWEHVDCSETNFSEASMRNSRFYNTKLKGANFRGTDLTNAFFSNTDITREDLLGPDFEGAITDEVEFYTSPSTQKDVSTIQGDTKKGINWVQKILSKLKRQ
jgi:uncharacterized protein YjbI with pentapeptide repeats